MSFQKIQTFTYSYFSVPAILICKLDDKYLQLGKLSEPFYSWCHQQINSPDLKHRWR